MKNLMNLLVSLLVITHVSLGAMGGSMTDDPWRFKSSELGNKNNDSFFKDEEAKSKNVQKNDTTLDESDEAEEIAEDDAMASE